MKVTITKIVCVGQILWTNSVAIGYKVNEQV